MKPLPQIETPADQHEALKAKRRHRLRMLASYGHSDNDADASMEGGIHATLDAQDEADRLVRGVLGRGQ